MSDADPTDEPVAARELVARTFDPSAPRQLPPGALAIETLNCVAHRDVPLRGRPVHDCALCVWDLGGAYMQALDELEWLRRWRADALEVLRRQDAALAMLQGWECRERKIGVELWQAELTTPMIVADLVRPAFAAADEILLQHLLPSHGRTLEQFLARVGNIADGLDEEGGSHGHGR